MLIPGQQIAASAFFDGAVRGKRTKGAPGTGPGACAVLMAISNDPAPIKQAMYLGPKCKINSCEYNGMILALTIAKARGVSHLQLLSDSMLVVQQSLGEWAVRDEAIKKLWDRAQKIALDAFEVVEIKHIPRHENRADQLACDLLDAKTGRKRR